MERNELEAVLRREWQDTIEHSGGHCPVCNRWGKVNAIALRGVMVKTMHWLHQVGGGKWVYVPGIAPRFVTRSYAFASLKHWGLVEQRHEPPLTKEERQAGVQRDTRTSGMWKLTPTGYDFIFNGAAVPKHVFVYNDTRIGVSDDMVTARECAHEKFNYDAMMGASFNGDYDGLDYA